MTKVLVLFKHRLTNDSSHNYAILTFPLNVKGGWIRASAHVYYPDREWEVWKQVSIGITLKEDYTNSKSKSYRIPRVTDEGSWQEIYIDIKVPGTQILEGCLDFGVNLDGSKKLMFVDDIEIKYTPLSGK
jgi:hypothetical protein